MSIETNSRDSEPISLRPKNEKALTVDETCKAQQEAFKITLEENLKKGVDILNQQDFEKLAEMTSKYPVGLDLTKIKFSEINNGVGIVIKKDGATFTAYNLNNPKLLGNLSTQVGTFTNGAFEKMNVIVSFFAPNHNRIEDRPLPADGVTCKTTQSPISNTGNNIPSPLTPKSEASPDIHVPYTIKKGDSLWKIIKKKYRLSDTLDDANLVWNMIEGLKKDTKNKGVIKDETGKIFVGETLYLPKNFQLTYKGAPKSILMNELAVPIAPIASTKEGEDQKLTSLAK